MTGGSISELAGVEERADGSGAMFRSSMGCGVVGAMGGAALGIWTGVE